MDRTDSTDYHDLSQNNSEIQDAEKAVSLSGENFESAMDHLAKKVDGSSRRVKQAVNSAKEMKDGIVEMKDMAKESAISMAQLLNVYFQQAVRVFSHSATRARQNPRPYVIGAAAGLIGGLVLVDLITSRSRSQKKAIGSLNINDF